MWIWFKYKMINTINGYSCVLFTYYKKLSEYIAKISKAITSKSFIHR